MLGCMYAREKKIKQKSHSLKKKEKRREKTEKREKRRKKDGVTYYTGGVFRTTGKKRYAQFFGCQ